MDTLFPMEDDDARIEWHFDPGRGTPGVFLRKLVLMESVTPLKIIRRIPFHAGLNIVWADPKTESARKGGSRLAGHSAGKTTFCRILRWLLGEPRFGNDTLHQSVADAFPKGFAALHLELEGDSWIVGRAYWDSSKHWAVPGDAVDDFLKTGIPSKPSAEEFFEALETQSVSRLNHRTLPGIGEPLRWTDLLTWLTRDQDSALQSIDAWRANTAGISRSIATKETRHLIMRLFLGLLDEEEWKEKDRCAELEEHKERELKQKPELEAAALASSEPLKYMLENSERSLKGDLLLAEVRARINRQRAQKETLRQEFENLDHQGAEQRANEALVNRVKKEQQIDATKRRIQRLEKRIAERDAEAIKQKQREIQQNRGLPPGICGRLKEDVAGQCKFYREAPQPIGTPQTAADIEQNRDHLLEQLDEEKATLEIAKQDMPLLEEAEARCLLEKNRIFSERQRLQLELAQCSARLDVSTDILKIAEEAGASRDRSESEIRLLTSAIRESTQRQKGIRDAHREARLEFAAFYQKVLRELTGSDTTANVEYDKEGLLDLTVKTRETVSSAAIEALKVIAFDLAAAFWSAGGRGHHPRFLIHDSPRVADMASVPYAAIFELAAGAEKHSSPQANFQYIITTTESPPKTLKDRHLILKLDASRPEGRLFGLDF